MHWTEHMLYDFETRHKPDVSPRFQPNEYDRQVGMEMVRLAGTQLAIVRFAELCEGLTDNAYWFYLSTCWVQYSGWSDLQLWKRLFRSTRPYRSESIMKPSEVQEFSRLPNRVTAYRAHRPGETDWIAYTLSPEIGRRFARERGVDTIAEYQLRRQDLIALFTRRGEQEILMLDPARARKVADHPV